ncbi:pentapeptide repeat-containing protein [Spartinivicinus poritis]|uniref:Pentapeptide repeat-containing protein n=1 Tax=Spartinivicinus poritis TaxID=2994640 RepID=A0ABT5UH62_9GAMM|nr:pentapeptide repeat-containing protein [Spartinivicinus sp. A2-2]MDE1465710.1 pentapeptide repeat-containing protein [Spartinivicinus sp. A2-2]
MLQPKPIQHPLYDLLQDEKVKEFNKKRAAGETCDFSGGHFRGLDLRGINADGLNFSGAYFRAADLRGVDLSKANIEGASFADAKISGVYFPKQVSPEEIRLSVDKGTRVRYR